MLKDISKKLTMKKSFFVTQLEGFFNAISQEYQEIIHQKEVENSLLEEKIQKLENDVQNLVAIRHKLQKELDKKEDYIKSLENNALESKDAHYKKLLEENIALKEKLHQNSDQEVNDLKNQIEKLQKIIAAGTNSYQDTLSSQNKEDLIAEISKNLKR